MGKLADRIFFGVQGPWGLGLGCRSLCLAFIVYGKTSRYNICWCSGPTGVGFGVPFFVSGLYKFMGKLADRICFGVQGPRGLGLGCRSLCLAFISLWEN